MINELINSELNESPYHGLQFCIIKKYVLKTDSQESFIVNNFCILLIKSGAFKIQLKDTVHDLSAQDLIVIPKNTFLTLLDAEDKLKLYLIAFTAEFATQNCFKKELVNAFYFYIARPSLKITLDQKDFLVLSLIYKLIYFIRKEGKLDGIEAELQRISFNLLLYELRSIHAKYTSQAALNFNRKERILIQFFTILSIHCKKQHSVKFYAGSLFITAGYLSKIVKQITGKPVKILIAESIIAEAKNLLEDSQLSVADIAEELSFSNSSTFCVFFKRHTSIAPSRYRTNAIERLKNQ
ncbi:helix-turn-helix domain-containing protein [Flavobacterium sp. CAN_S2]|uniref:helix-turn-helix domain-containing protein n=1 Tax=Flavobacterium sp. CAN_S2 TaxID=2787726 RepID=UPI0018C8F4E1